MGILIKALQLFLCQDSDFLTKLTSSLREFLPSFLILREPLLYFFVDLLPV